MLVAHVVMFPRLDAETDPREKNTRPAPLNFYIVYFGRGGNFTLLFYLMLFKIVLGAATQALYTTKIRGSFLRLLLAGLKVATPPPYLNQF